MSLRVGQAVRVNDPFNPQNGTVNKLLNSVSAVQVKFVTGRVQAYPQANVSALNKHQRILKKTFRRNDLWPGTWIAHIPADVELTIDHRMKLRSLYRSTNGYLVSYYHLRRFYEEV